MIEAEPVPLRDAGLGAKNKVGVQLPSPCDLGVRGEGTAINTLTPSPQPSPPQRARESERLQNKVLIKYIYDFFVYDK